MDTLITLTVVSDSQDTAERAIESAFLETEKLERLTNFFSPESEISLINKNAGVSWIKVSSDTMDLLTKSLYVSEKTNGAFDITIGTVTALYDFHKKIIPGEDSIKRNLSLVNFNDLTVDRKKSMVFLRKKGMLIDTGGITKGYAADKSVEVLKKFGITSGLVAVAGDIRTFGLKPDGRPWKIGIRNPRAKDGEDDIIATIELTDMAISTSGDYERFFMFNGERFHHLLSPRTGHPARECRSVTVIAKDGIFTDSFATGVFILGPAEGMKVLEKMGFEGIIVDAQGKTHVTQGLRGKIEFKKAA